MSISGGGCGGLEAGVRERAMVHGLTESERDQRCECKDRGQHELGARRGP